MTSAGSSIADHLISFDSPSEVNNVYPFPEGDAGQSELEKANQKIAELQQRLEEVEATAALEAQQKIDELVRAKDEELQAGLDDLKATYETSIAQLTEQLQSQLQQYKKEMAVRVSDWCKPVIRSLGTKRCVEDMAAALETLLEENSQMVVSGPQHLLDLIEPHLAHLPSPSWSCKPTESTEIVISGGDARIETCLEEWLDSVEGQGHVS
jgi:small-conductance mechanosensitive channel